MVDFAIAAERARGLTPEQSIREACLQRYRPILMTTLAAISVPAFGAGNRPRLGTAATSGHHHRRRSRTFANPDPLYDAVIYILMSRFSRTNRPSRLQRIAMQDQPTR